MNLNGTLTRITFACLSILLFTTFALTSFPLGLTVLNAFLGASLGLVFFIFLFAAEFILRTVSLRQLNTLALGLFFGYALGQALILVIGGVFDFAAVSLSTQAFALIKSCAFLFSVYFGVLFTAAASEEIYFSIPFLKLKPKMQTKKDLIADFSVLSDPRFIDLASSGLIDNHLILPRFVLKEIYQIAESEQDSNRPRARRALEVVKKLEEMPELHFKFSENDFPEVKGANEKLIRLARFLDANLLTADISQIDQSSIEGIKIINMHTLAKALKPLTQSGEILSIKVQRYGKEARQGVGYLDDGTMVVINGGADFIGETIKAQVLSVKHTSSGRMIFCNAMDEFSTQTEEAEHTLSSMEESTKNYYTI